LRNCAVDHVEASVAPNKRKILEAARKHTQKGAKDRALKEYEKLLKLDPRDAKLRLEIGDAYRRWGQVEDAISAYTKVAEQYMQEGFDARAVAVFKQIQNLDTDCWDSYVPLAELYQRMGLNSEAIQALQTAADGFNRAGKKRDALDLLRRMATLDPSNTTSRIKVADLLRQEGMESEAIAEYEAAHAVLDEQGESEAASTVLERILEVAPTRVATLVLLGRNLLQRGFGERAEPFVKRVLEAEADVPSHYELLADVYRAQQRDAELADTYRSLADLYRRRGDEDSAREIIQRFVPPNEMAAPLEPDAGAVGTALQEGPTLVGEELLDDEIELSDAAPSVDEDLAEKTVLGLGVEPDEGSSTDELPLDEEVDASESEVEGDPDQLLAEASVYLRYGKREQALRNLRGVLSRQPDHRGALEKLGEAHADGGETEAAVDAWLRAAEGARAQGDTDAVAVLRDRIAALDEQAAAALGEVAPKPDPPEDELLDLSDAELQDLDEVTESPPELEHDIEIEIDAEEHEIEIDIDAGELDEEPAAVAEPEAPSLEDAAAEAGLSLGASASSSISARVGEELEEAEFYRQQGLLDEAEPIYRRILEQAPNHPLALVRMGEIAAQRGDDPGSTGSGVAAPVDELEDWTDDGLDETDVEFDAPDAVAVTAPDLEDDDTGLDLEPAAADPSAADEEPVDLGLDADEEPVDLGLDEDEEAVDVETEMDPLVDEPVDDAAAAELCLDAAAEEPSAAAASDDGTSDGDSFDLAAELSDALDDGESASTGSLGTMSEQDVFSAVFSEFKKGVSKTLTEADHEAHYDLGIAYREMGLLDDALGEFQAAKQSPARRVDSLHMLGMCKLDLGRPEEALTHLQEGLDAPDVPDDQAMAVRFELGRVYESLGCLDEARDAWQAVAARDSSFCEVEERLASLGEAKPDAEVPAEEEEDLESFEDLFDGDDDEPEPAPGDGAEASSPQPFEDRIAEANADLDDSEPDEPVADEPEAAPEPEPEPEPEPRRRRKKKISFV
jgi:tetratricopeptide (TPR) repeat protein